jgi:hypothetical protein
LMTAIFFCFFLNALVLLYTFNNIIIIGIV